MNDFVRQWQRLIGVPDDGIFGPATLAASIKAQGAPKPPAAPPPQNLPWVAEMQSVLGLHESRDKARLQAWLKSDGKTLGDPTALPWCGDAMETAMKNGLPSEPFPGALGQNPYWARNWLRLGAEVAPTYGAVLVFERPGGGGHVGFAVGQDDTALHVLGGNQSNAVTVARIAKTRLLGARWPATFPRPITPRLPRIGAGGKLSTNEA